jgi:hypothetical protein
MGSYSLGGLTFGGSTLYAVLSNFSNTTSDFYVIDPTTGAATFIGDIPFDEVSGITGIASAPPSVPEPSTCVLMAGATLALTAFRRRIKSTPGAPSASYFGSAPVNDRDHAG